LTISKDLFLSILSMDAYNRGHNPGISGLSDASDGTIHIGNATISYNLSDAGTLPAAQAASFNAAPYTINSGVTGIAAGTTVISDRGTSVGGNGPSCWPAQSRPTQRSNVRTTHP
jgi:hypothetical protein